MGIALAAVGADVSDKVGKFVSEFWKAKRNHLRVMFLCSVLALSGGFVYIRSRSTPPRERKLIENFYAHRTAYDRLRDMLEADQHLLRVAKWGVETTESVGVHVPPEGKFPISRYNEYLALLRETGGNLAFRGRGEHPESVGVGVWAAGWGGDSRHIDVVWMDHEPPNRVANLDDYYQDSARPRRVFRHIDGNWYFWADW
jgi:hypothetical protein